LVTAYALLSVAEKPAVAGTIVTSDCVDACGVAVTVVVRLVCTLIQVDTAESNKAIAAISDIAGADVAADVVCTGSVRVTDICCTLVDILTVDTISNVTIYAFTSEAAVCVFAYSQVVAVVCIGRAFVNIDAVFASTTVVAITTVSAITVSDVTLTTEASQIVRAGGGYITSVTAIVALVDIDANLAVSTVTVVAAAGVTSVSIVAEGVGVTDRVGAFVVVVALDSVATESGVADAIVTTSRVDTSCLAVAVVYFS